MNEETNTCSQLSALTGAGDTTTAADMARSVGIDPKQFRSALRRAGLEWHSQNQPWKVHLGSPEHQDMQEILGNIGGSHRVSVGDRNLVRRRAASRNRASSDEGWIIDLCDNVLGFTAIRQHRFDFLRGDPSPSGRTVRLPVDAFYPELKLVIEYRERQHSQPVKLWDTKPTISGVGRGEQRRCYDNRRRVLLPEHGYRLIEFEYSEFGHTRNGRLLREYGAKHVIVSKLSDYINKGTQ